jgi:uncharacterized membrane protein
MEVEKTEASLLYKAIEEWTETGKLTAGQAVELKDSIIIKQNERHQIAQYFLFVALFCTLLAFGAIFLNEKLLEKIKIYFSWSDMVITMITALLSVLWLWYIARKRSHLSDTAYEIYNVLGCLSVLTSLVYLCKELGVDKTHTAFLSMATPTLILISILLRSRATWISAIIIAVAWFGSFSTWLSVDNLFLGMNYPLRFTVFGAAVLGFSFLQAGIRPVTFTRRITYVAGLLLFFTGLWGISIFGNYNTLAQWHLVRQIHVLAYSIFFGIVAAISFYLGIRYKDEYARDFGVLFLIINFYTRYFEYFWDGMNKGLFFLILAITFGFVGWFLERKAKKPKTVQPVRS